MAELSGRVTMLDSATLAPVGRPVQLDQAVCCVAAGPDDHAIVLTGPRTPQGSGSTRTRAGRSSTSSPARVVDEGDLENGGNDVDFSPDGRHAAIAGRDGRLLVLDLLAGEPLRPPVLGHDDLIRSVRTRRTAAHPDLRG